MEGHVRGWQLGARRVGLAEEERLGALSFTITLFGEHGRAGSL